MATQNRHAAADKCSMAAQQFAVHTNQGFGKANIVLWSLPVATSRRTLNFGHRTMLYGHIELFCGHRTWFRGHRELFCRRKALCDHNKCGHETNSECCPKPDNSIILRSLTQRFKNLIQRLDLCFYCFTQELPTLERLNPTGSA